MIQKGSFCQGLCCVSDSCHSSDGLNNVPINSCGARSNIVRMKNIIKYLTDNNINVAARSVDSDIFFAVIGLPARSKSSIQP